MDRRKRLARWLVVLALIAAGCEGSARLKTHTYRFSAPANPDASEDYRKAYCAEYGTWFFRRLLYGSDESSAGPMRGKFIRPSSARGAVSVRDTALNHQRLKVYLQTLAGGEVDLSKLEPGVVYVFRANLFQEPPSSCREARIRSQYLEQVVSDLDELLQLPEKSGAVVEWSRHCTVYDRGQGWLDLYCAPEKWPEVRTFIETLSPPEPYFSYDSLFDPNNAALYYLRAMDHFGEASRPPGRLKAKIPSLEEASGLSIQRLQETLQPFEDALATLLLARGCPGCDLKPIRPDTPDSPQPCPHEGMLDLARLLAAQSLFFDRSGSPQNALESALTIVKMGLDWNQGPLPYRRLGVEMVDLGGRSLTLFFSQVRNRALCQQASEEILKFSQAKQPLDPSAFEEAVRPYHFEAGFESPVIQEDFQQRVQDAFVRSQVALAQCRLLSLRALVNRYQQDQGAYPDQLEALVPGYAARLPLDPFGEGTLSYRVTGRTPQIYSLGPDRKDNYGSLLYNPTNGVLSSGDVYFP